MLERGRSRPAFEREMRALGALHHPNVVQVMGVVALPGGRLGLVEALAEGGSSAAW